MTWASRSRPARLAASLLLLFALNTASQTTIADPITVETPTPKKVKFQGEVLAMTRVAITVRSRDNFNLVRTFTYQEKLAAKMAKMIDRNRPFQHGDRVEIIFLEGSDQAIKVKGKPSQKP